VVSPGTYRTTTPLETGIVVTSFFTCSLRDSTSSGSRSTASPLIASAAAVGRA
jgi:hypothetical protein